MSGHKKESENAVRAFLNCASVVVVSVLVAADVKCACGAFATVSLYTHFHEWNGCILFFECTIS